MPPLPPKSKNSVKAFLSLIAIKTLVKIRCWVFSIGNRILKKPFNGADLLITGIKKGS
jgi:hypothetical protein